MSFPTKAAAAAAAAPPRFRATGLSAAGSDSEANAIVGAWIYLPECTIDTIILPSYDSDGAKCRIGIYDTHATTLYPTDLLYDSGEFTHVVGFNEVSPALEITTEGWYLICFIGNGGYDPIYYLYGAYKESYGAFVKPPNGFYKSQTYGALPDPMVSGGDDGYMPIFYLLLS